MSNISAFKYFFVIIISLCMPMYISTCVQKGYMVIGNFVDWC